MPVISNTGIYNCFFEVMTQKNGPLKKNDNPANLLLINKTLMRICPHLEYKGYPCPCNVNKTNRKESVNQPGCCDDVFDKMPGFHMILMVFDDHLKLDNSHGSWVMSIFSECYWFMDQNHMNSHWLGVDRWDDPNHGLLAGIHMRCTAEEPRCPVPSQDANKWRCCCDETVDSDERHVCLDGAGFAYMIIYIYTVKYS